MAPCTPLTSDCRHGSNGARTQTSRHKSETRSLVTGQECPRASRRADDHSERVYAARTLIVRLCTAACASADPRPRKKAPRRRRLLAALSPRWITRITSSALKRSTAVAPWPRTLPLPAHSASSLLCCENEQQDPTHRLLRQRRRPVANVNQFARM